jgi:hypothetical protein
MLGAAGQNKPGGNPDGAPPALNPSMARRDGEIAGDTSKGGMDVEQQIAVPSRMQRTLKFLDTKFACTNQRDRNV